MVYEFCAKFYSSYIVSAYYRRSALSTKVYVRKVVTYVMLLKTNKRVKLRELVLNKT